eukprot:COSAG05_NODE_1887_length_3886_cov_6.005545_6_plen_170_part_00
MFWQCAEQEHERPDLIWNATLLGELRHALEQQVRRPLSSPYLSWTPLVYIRGIQVDIHTELRSQIDMFKKERQTCVGDENEIGWNPNDFRVAYPRWETPYKNIRAHCMEKLIDVFCLCWVGLLCVMICGHYSSLDREMSVCSGESRYFLRLLMYGRDDDEIAVKVLKFP